MAIFLYSIVLVLAFYLIAQVSDKYFIPSLDSISKKLNISSDIAGATFMAVGSSAPELFIALIAVFHPGGHEEIGMGTIVGSALFNVLAIIGAVALVRKAIVSWQPILRDTLFYLLSIAVITVIFLNDDISFFESLLLLGLYLFYILAIIFWKKIFPYKDDAVKVEETENVNTVKRYRLFHLLIRPIDFILSLTFPNTRYYFWNFLISIIWIAFLSWALVESAIEISTILNIPEGIIALTVLAVGTSVPDLIASLLVAKKGFGGMAISNAIGSNIFDILLGLGLPWIIALTFYKDTIKVSSNNIFSSVVLLFSSVIVVFLLLGYHKWEVRKPTGVLLLTLYIAYLVWQILSVILK